MNSERNLDTAFLGNIRANPESLWTAQLLLNEVEISVKLDTGAEVTAISEETYQRLGRPELQQPSKVLFGPARQTLDVIGQFAGTLKWHNHTSQHTVFVVRGLRNNLLGLPAIISLQLLYRVNSVDEGNDVRKRFPKVFSGLGNLGDDYIVKLKEGAVPYALFTPRNVPIPLREKVREELTRMENMGVISKIEQPTSWCAGMVVVPKRSGAVRICVDLKPLNQSVLREPHPIPKVDETLAQVAGAKMFSKLDANSGFWQIPLAKQSRPLTTFITPFGRYCFNKLPFGISSAPELFQRRMNLILEGLEGTLCYMDDVLVYGATRAEHDARLEAVMKRLEAAGVTLNSDKCVSTRHSQVSWPRDRWGRHQSRSREDFGCFTDDRAYQRNRATPIPWHDQSAREVLSSDIRAVPTSPRVVKYEAILDMGKRSRAGVHTA